MDLSLHRSFSMAAPVAAKAAPVAAIATHLCPYEAQYICKPVGAFQTACTHRYMHIITHVGTYDMYKHMYTCIHVCMYVCPRHMYVLYINMYVCLDD